MKKNIFLLFILYFLPVSSMAGNYPIIFVHGHKSDAKPIDDNPEDKDYGWETWFPMKNDFTLEYPTVMTRLISSHYGGYSAGDPLHCDKDSTPRATNVETRKIYNFSSYFNDVLKKTENTKRQTRNMKVIALEWLGGAALSSASWYLSRQLIPEESWNDPAGVALIGLVELNLGAPLGSSIGTTFVGKIFNQDRSFWSSLLGGFIGSWAGFIFAGEDKIGLGIVLGSSVGAVIGYNIGGVR